MRVNKITYMDIATKCQVHLMTVYKWVKIDENDTTSIPSDSLKKIAEIFNVTMEELYTMYEVPAN